MPTLGVDVLLVWLLSVAAFVAVVALIVVASLRVLGLRGDGSGRRLRQRLVRGEITQAEVDDARRIIGR